MLIGITGTDGAGKGAVVEYLVDKKGFVHYSSRELITAEIQKRGLEVSRDTLRLVGNDMRKHRGLDVIVQVALEKMKAENTKNVIIESIRAVKEAETLKATEGILLAIDANQELRYSRITARASETDKITFAEFVAQEEIEMNDPDPNGMQKAAVITAADYTIYNDGSFEELQHAVDVFLEKYHD